MRTVIAQVTVSLDGYVAPAQRASDHRGSEDSVLKQTKLEMLKHVGTHVMGRVTYEEMAQYWPTSSDEYAPPMNDRAKVVFSKTLESAVWEHSRVARGELASEIAALKEEPGGDIIAWGGASFLQALSRAGLVDEYRLVINPVALGDGLPLFKDLGSPLRLRLVQATTYQDGSALHVYRPTVKK